MPAEGVRGVVVQLPVGGALLCCCLCLTSVEWRCKGGRMGGRVEGGRMGGRMEGRD